MTSSQQAGEASYAVVARVLNAMFSPDAPVSSSQVHAWFKRETKNKDGVPFPRPAREVPEPKRGQPHFLFSVAAVADWYRAGVPDVNNKGWRNTSDGNGEDLTGNETTT